MRHSHPETIGSRLLFRDFGLGQDQVKLLLAVKQLQDRIHTLPGCGRDQGDMVVPAEGLQKTEQAEILPDLREKTGVKGDFFLVRIINNG